MKTKLTTIKGSVLTLSITGDTFIVEVRNQKVKLDHIQFHKGVLQLGRINGTRAQAEIPKNEHYKITALKRKLEKVQQEKKENDYAFLIEKLPQRKLKGGNDNKKAKKLLDLANKQTFYSNDDEDEGLNLAVQSEIESLRSQAYKHCTHTEIDISYSYGFTADARQKLTREMKCNTCGKTIRDSASEDLPESAIWR
jgi:hypothetical protein